MLGNSQLFHHVEHPHRIRLVGSLRLLPLERTVVLAVAKALRVEALHLAAAGDIPQPIPLHQWCAADPLQGPVVHAAGGELLAGILPEERAILGVEGEQAAQIDAGRVALQIALAVVGADIGLAAGHHGIAVALAAKRRHPGNVAAGSRTPNAGVDVKIPRCP